MGIPRGTARLLLEEHRHRPFGGRLLQLGRSSVYFGIAELERWASRHQVRLARGVEVRLSHDPRLARQGCIDDRTFFSLLGFSAVESCDVSAWEGADHLLDLNRPLPEELAGRFDVVLDPGTTVQLFHLPNVLRNLHALLRPEGRVVHAALPSNNHMDLGFFMPCPTLLHDFYEVNRWRLDTELLCEYFPYWHRGRLYTGTWKAHRYTPGSLDHLSYGRYGGAQAALFVVATKIAGATGDVVPQIGQYVRSWEAFAARAGDPAAAAGELLPPPGRGGRSAATARSFEAFLERHPALDRLYRPVKGIKERLRRLLPRRMPPLAGRY